MSDFADWKIAESSTSPKVVHHSLIKNCQGLEQERELLLGPLVDKSLRAKSNPKLCIVS